MVAVRPEHAPEGHTCNVPPSPPEPPGPPPPPPIPITPFYNGTEFADAYCSGPPVREWVVNDISTSAETADTGCVSPHGTWSVQDEWCDFSGWQPKLHGTLFSASSDCSTTGEPFGDYYSYGSGFAADGSCVMHSDGTSSLFHCVVSVCATGDDRMCSSTGCYADVSYGQIQSCEGGYEPRPSRHASHDNPGAYTCVPSHCAKALKPQASGATPRVRLTCFRPISAQALCAMRRPARATTTTATRTEPTKRRPVEMASCRCRSEAPSTRAAPTPRRHTRLAWRLPLRLRCLRCLRPLSTRQPGPALLLATVCARPTTRPTSATQPVIPIGNILRGARRARSPLPCPSR